MNFTLISRRQLNGGEDAPKKPAALLPCPIAKELIAERLAAKRTKVFFLTEVQTFCTSCTVRVPVYAWWMCKRGSGKFHRGNVLALVFWRMTRSGAKQSAALAAAQRDVLPNSVVFLLCESTSL